MAETRKLVPDQMAQLPMIVACLVPGSSEILVVRQFEIDGD